MTDEEIKKLEEEISYLREKRDKLLISETLNKLEYEKYYRVSASNCEIIFFKYAKENIELTETGLRIKKCLRESLTLSSSSIGVHFNYSLNLTVIPMPLSHDYFEVKEISEEDFYNKINETIYEISHL